jgi:hypothetical protein
VTKHYPREQRLVMLRIFRVLAKMYPDECFICRRKQDVQKYKLTMADFLGGDGEIDGDFEGPVCKRCLHTGQAATQAILTTKAMRS